MSPLSGFPSKKALSPSPLHPIIVVNPFSKWGIDFMQCRHTSVEGYGYIIVVVDYFTRWVEAMPIFSNDDKTATLFVFNHIISRFGVFKAIVIDHGSHFCNHMMVELSDKLGFLHDNSSPYYPQSNGQFEVINKVLKTMIQQMVGIKKYDWHLNIFPALWAYRTSTKTTTGFTPFQLLYGL
jgi:hypothetical protein